jgi:hypothetical protein
MKPSTTVLPAHQEESYFGTSHSWDKSHVMRQMKPTGLGLEEGLRLIEEELQLWGRGNGYTVKKLPVHLPKHFTVRILLRLLGVIRG